MGNGDQKDTLPCRVVCGLGSQALGLEERIRPLADETLRRSIRTIGEAWPSLRSESARWLHVRRGRRRLYSEASRWLHHLRHGFKS